MTNNLGLARLRNGDEIVTGLDGRDAVSLDRGGDVVSAELDVTTHGRVEACILELVDRLNPLDAFLRHIDLGDSKSFRLIS